MQVYESLRNNKKKKAFTLIEIIIALGIIAVISILIFPSLLSLIRNSYQNKNEAKIIFALQDAIENNKEKNISEFIYDVEGIEVNLSIKEYEQNNEFKIIQATYKNKSLKLVVEKWKKHLHY